MPLFTPGRRWQPAYYSFEEKPFLQKAMAALERAIKGPLFGCRMCGNCLLAGDCLHLSDGMPKRVTKWSLRRINSRSLLCRSHSAMYLVQNL